MKKHKEKIGRVFLFKSGVLCKAIRYFGRIANEIFVCFPGYLTGISVFILMPFALYLPNQSTYNNDLIFIAPYLFLAVVFLIVLISLHFFIGNTLKKTIVILFFYFGVYLILSDILFPIQLSELMNGNETPEEPLFFIIAEIVMAIIIIICSCIPFLYLVK